MVFDVYKFVGTYVKGVGTDRWDGVDHNSHVDSLWKVTSIAFADSPYTALDGDFCIECDTTGGSITVNLPAANNGASKPRKEYLIVKTNAANTLTIDGNASETINGATTKAVTAIYDGYYIKSNGTNWIGWQLISGSGSGEANTASTVGSGTAWTKTKVGVDLPFKSFIVDGTLTLTSNTNDLSLSVNQSGLTLGNLAGTLAATKGGTNQTTWTTGDLLYASALNTLAKRAIGSTADFLQVVGGIPTWAALPATVLENDQDNALGAHPFTMQEVTEPATPAADTITVFAVDQQARTVLATKNSIGRVTYLTGEDTYRVTRAWWVSGGTNSNTGLNACLPVSHALLNTGTGAVANVAADTDGGRKTFGTGATINSRSSFHSNTQCCTRTNNPRFRTKFKLSSIADVLIWIGLFELNGASADPLGADSTATQEKVAFRFSSTQGNANFNIVNCDGTTESVIEIAAAADTGIHSIYLEIDHPNSRMLYGFDDNSLIQSTANLPAAGTPLTLWIGITNLAAAAKNLDFWWLDGASDD